MLVYTLLSFQDSGEIKKQLDWWVGCQNFSPVSIMQLNIASPFFDKYWNISRNHTSFFSKMMIKYLSKSEQQVPALVYPPCQICNSDATNMFCCTIGSAFRFQCDLPIPSLSRLFSLFLVHHGSKDQLFQKWQLTQWQVNTLMNHISISHLFFFSFSLSPHSVSFLLGKGIRKANEYLKNTFSTFFFLLNLGVALGYTLHNG